MERDEFVVAVSWLSEADVDYWSPNPRSDVGAAFGWTEADRWYTERARLDEVYDFIQAHGNDLFYRLTEAIEVDQRQRWLVSVAELKSPVLTPVAQQANSAASPATPATPASETPARKSAFGSRSSAESASQESAVASAAPAGPAATSPARKSIFKAKSQPESQPATGTATTASSRPAPPEEQVGAVDQQIQTVMSELSADELSAIAKDLGLSPDEVEAIVGESDFAEMVAELVTEEQAPLAAERG
jgi:hypothetical protein